MFEHAICFECIKDPHLREIVKHEGGPLLCEVCEKEMNNAFTYEQLGEALGPVIRQNFEHGPMIKMFYDDDKEGWEQEGDVLMYICQEVLGQDVEDEQALVDAVIEAEDYDPGQGDEAFFDNALLYVRSKATPYEWMSNWHDLRDELAHRRRFFSESARMFFDRLFDGINALTVYSDEVNAELPVVTELPPGTEIARARVIRSDLDLKSFVISPEQELGAPPPEKARAGRMNADGISVFYGAMDPQTCMAEMRPVLGGRILIGIFKTTKAIRLLDFRRLQEARLAELSYFDGNFLAERERAVFLRRLHRLISQPVIPGHEDDYLITQTMAEYLAHLHRSPLDGVIFKSVQREGGANVVLFGRHDFEQSMSAQSEDLSKPFLDFDWPEIEIKPIQKYPVEFVANSAKLHVTRVIEYEHDELHYHINGDRIFVHDDGEAEDFDD